MKTLLELRNAVGARCKALYLPYLRRIRTVVETAKMQSVPVSYSEVRVKGEALVARREALLRSLPQ